MGTTNLPMTSLVAGLVSSIQLLVLESTNCPSINNFVVAALLQFLCNKRRDWNNKKIVKMAKGLAGRGLRRMECRKSTWNVRRGLARLLMLGAQSSLPTLIGTQCRKDIDRQENITSQEEKAEALEEKITKRILWSHSE